MNNREAYEAHRLKCRIIELEAALREAKERFETIDDKLDGSEAEDPELTEAMNFARTGRIEAERVLCGLPRPWSSESPGTPPEPKP